VVPQCSPGRLAPNRRRFYTTRMTAATPPLRLGSRGSPLALRQAEIVRERLHAANPALAEPGAVEIVPVKTTGDVETKRRLAEIGGKGLFTKELEDALFDGRIDAAVHSLKDVPTWLPDGLTLAAVPERADPRDAWFSPQSATIAGLPAGATVGTASLRRQAQILALRPDVRIVTFRGNLQTRLRKLAAGEADATLLAHAGLARMDMADEATAVLDPAEMLPGVAQGALALETRANDARTRDLVAAIDDPAVAARVHAERACLAVLDGSCRTPIGVLVEPRAHERVYVRALVAWPDGSERWDAERTGPAADAGALARDAGHELRRRAGEDFFARLAEML